MFLSRLCVDIGENPDRPRPGRLWLRNLYRVHQRLCMAFPSPSRKSADADFLKPYKPEDLDPKQVHIDRSADTGFLFRIDPIPGGRAVIIVQSASEPDWNYAFHNADYLLAAPPEVKPFSPNFEKGQRFRFRLMANPTRKIDTKSGPDGKRRNGKRVAISPSEFEEWLIKRSKNGAGFSIDKESITLQPSYVYVKDDKKMVKGQHLRSVRYEGVLEVTDPVGFHETVIQGIGPAKAFGFGLLSLARL